MSLKKLSLALVAVGMLLSAARIVSADTITLHDLSQNTATGVFTYTVQLDNAANVQTGDGFVLYDFPGVTSATLTGGLFGSQFIGSLTLTSNNLNQSASVDANGNVAALSNGITFDDPTISNLTISYVGPPVPFLGAATAILTITSTVHGGTTDSVYASIDHSGPNSGTPFSFSANPITVPAASVPLPASSLGGAALIGLLALARAKKAACLN